MNSFIEFLVIDKNLSQLIIFLTLSLPVVATIVSIARHVIGWKSFGIYAPIALTYAFYELGRFGNNTSNPIEGIKYGLTLTAIVFIFATIFHLITKKIRLHYVPKMSLVLTGVVLGVLGAMAIGAYFDKSGFITVDILALLLIITIAEQYINLYVNKNGKSAITLGVLTVLLSILAYLIISWQPFQDLLLDYPFYVLGATVIINLIVGMLTTLRITEIFRFWDILTKEPTED